MRRVTTISAFLAGILAVIFSCLSFGDAVDGSPENAAGQKSSGSTSQGRTQRANAPLYTGDGGKGIVIAVPTPVMRNNTAVDKWMPQLFQDLITGDLARYSAMTVLDRTNESLVIAEQTLSETGLYSDNDYIELGNMTNARYIAAGNIQNVSGRYNVSFRINNIETNEIKASFSKAYSLNDIETGLAAKEAVRELLAGMGVELTADGEKSLLAIQPVDVRATAQLARGLAAAKSDNIVESLAFLSDALNSNSTRNEANKHIKSFFVDIPTGSIRERANYAQAQAEKWNKIFSDLEMYLIRNLPIIIYDFSVVEDKINISNKTVELKISPGVKIVPNRTALLVYKTIVDNWILVRKNAENKDWVGSVRLPRFGSSNEALYYLYYSHYTTRIGLYDDYNDRVAQFRWYGQSPNIHISYFKSDRARVNLESDFSVVAQHKYYEDAKFGPIIFSSIPLDKVTDTMTPKIERIFFSSIDPRPEIDIPIMTVAEWQAWLAQQGQAR